MAARIRTCRGCGAELPAQTPGAGRPRIWCATCRTLEHRKHVARYMKGAVGGEVRRLRQLETRAQRHTDVMHWYGQMSDRRQGGKMARGLEWALVNRTY